MKTFLITLILFLALSLNGLTLEFKHQVRVKEENIFIRDVLSNKGCPKNIWDKISNLKIGKLEKGKTFLNINSKMINKKLHHYDIKVKKGFISVRRYKYVFDEIKIKTDIKKYLFDKYNLSNKDKIEFVSLPSFFSYKKGSQIKYSEILSADFNQIRMKGEVYDSDYKYQPEYFSVIIKKLQKCYITLSAIKLHQPIKLGKNIIEAEKYFPLKNRYIHNFAEIKNCQTSKYLRKNQILKNNNIMKIPDVKRNQIVRILLENKIIKIEMEAKAISDGYIGDVIAFRNPNSNEKFNAEIVKKNLAIIKF